ncbi:TolC family outer membrane protein [Sulfurimonas aquatica]|nr:TolC family outer membrane protein [Sulfurimonas aquatica]
MIKKIVITNLFMLLIATSLFGLTLKESIIEAIDTNPVVQERLKNYRATQQDLNIAESEYYPQLDLSASYNYNRAGEINNAVVKQDYTNYETTLKFTQNLFDGFSTVHKIDYQEARILAAAYNYVEKSNDIAFKMTNAYISVMRAHDLLQTARENVQINRDIYTKVKDLFDFGLTTDSEVKKIESSLSLARSNLTVKKNNALDTEYNFRRVLGRMPQVQTMSKPELDVQLPESIHKAAQYAVNNNPSLLVSRYNIESAHSLRKQHQKEYYPRIDFEVSQTYNDIEEANAFNNADDRFKARVVLNYNIFRGGADDAITQKDLSTINQEVEIKRDLKRQVIEGLDLSWNAYEMIGLQLVDLREYREFSEKTLELYKEEYDLGRRSLLDLLSAQNDVINSRTQIIQAEYDQLFAKYRILDAMGVLPLAVIGDTKEFTSRVNLYSDGNYTEVLDSVPVSLDVDNDKIVDNQDICDNSLQESSVMPYGCVQPNPDSDGDGIFDSQDECPLTPRDIATAPNGCALDTDMDGVSDYLDECKKTPIGYDVDLKGCAIAITITVNFPRASAEIPADLEKKISDFALFMQNNTKFHAKITGYTSRTSVSEEAYNLKLSLDRADSFKQELINHGISAHRLSTDGKGYEKPIADNNTDEGRILNRRVEIELTTMEEF